MPSSIFLIFVFLSFFCNPLSASAPWIRFKNNTLADSKRFEGSSPFVNLEYHYGPVATSAIVVNIIWYGNWTKYQKSTIRDFISSFSDQSVPKPSLSSWWKTLTLYVDQTGHNVTQSVSLGSEKTDHYSAGTSLQRLTVMNIIKKAISSRTNPLVLNVKRSVVLVLTSVGVYLQGFCVDTCGFHGFTFPSVVGKIVPFMWAGNSQIQCPEYCAYPFAVPSYMEGVKALKPPNGEVGLDALFSVIAHELADISTNPLFNSWFAGDSLAPSEIADLCVGIFGTGAGGSYMGQILKDESGASYNLFGLGGRKFLVQWIWSPILSSCFGPNAIN